MAELGKPGGRMRILLLSDDRADPSMGGAKVAYKLQAALGRLGHDCEVALRPNLGSRPHAERLRLALAPWLAGRAARQLGRNRPFDVIDAAGAEGWRLHRAGGPPVVVRSHGLEHRYYQQLLADARAGLARKPWSRRLWYPATRLPQVAASLRRAQRVIVLSQADRRFVVARGWQPAANIEVIPHGVEASLCRVAPAPGARRGGGMLFCGWWTTSKGVHYLARAHALLLQNGWAIPLTLAGVAAPGAAWPRQQDQIRRAFAPASQPLLRLVPRVADEAAVFAHYASHDLLVCPSTSEGFGMVVIEALSQRLPVVCSRAAGAAELLRDGGEALLVEPRDPAALAVAIAQLWQNPELRARLGQAGHELARQLSWDQIAARTVSCYAAAVGGAASAAARR
ncbi:MAG: glycosyltransferase family 4 protein, partial [Terriglobales bacterium]